MNNKKVHWSQYADEISFLTIQDTVRLSDSVDDDYFSEESVDLEPLETPEKITRKNKGNPFGNYQFFPMDEYSLTKSLISGKSGFDQVYDSNYFKDPAPFERRKDSHNKFPRALKEDKFQEGKFKMKERWRDVEYEEENSNENEITYSINSDDNSTLSPRSYDDTLDTLSSPRKCLDDYWISPPISLSKRNSSVSRGDCIKSGRLNSDQKSEDRLSRISPVGRRSYQNVDEYRYRISKVRHRSESRRVRKEFI